MKESQLESWEKRHTENGMMKAVFWKANAGVHVQITKHLAKNHFSHFITYNGKGLTSDNKGSRKKG
jgi:hypothetical protein